jgi:hypothetical protein
MTATKIPIESPLHRLRSPTNPQRDLANVMRRRKHPPSLKANSTPHVVAEEGGEAISPAAKEVCEEDNINLRQQCTDVWDQLSKIAGQAVKAIEVSQ